MITIDPTSNFQSSTQYYIQIDASAFDDTSGNSFSGISNSSKLNFSTIDIISPNILSSNPSNDSAAVPVHSDIEISFSEEVFVDSGNIHIRKFSDDSLIESIDVTSDQLSGSGTKVITIEPTNNFQSSTHYYIQIDATAFEDDSNNYLSEIKDKTIFSFITADIIPPSLLNSIPSDNAKAVALNSNIELTFSEAVHSGFGNIYIKKTSDDSLVESIDVTSDQISGQGTNVIKISPLNELESFTKYYVQIDESSLKDNAGNTLKGENEISIINFTTIDNVNPIITGPSGIDIKQIYLKENSLDVFTFEADENVTWSISGGNDSSDFFINEDSGKLSFNAAPDFETPSDIDKNRSYEIVIKATDDFNNYSEQFVTITITDIGEKENEIDNYYKLSFLDNENSINESIFTTQHGDLVEDVKISRLEKPIINDGQIENFSIGQNILNLSLSLDKSSVNNGVEFGTDISALLDGVDLDFNNLNYYSLILDNSGQITSIKPFNYDPIKDVGARFYDLDNDGTADMAQVKYIDGSNGDNDKEVNGTTNLSPTTVASIDLKPIFGINNSILKIEDPANLNTNGNINLRTEIISKADTVNQIGYLVLDQDEDKDVSYDLLKNRGKIIFSNLENIGLPDISDISLTKDINLINGQKLILFEIVDNTLKSLLQNYSSIEEFGKDFNILSIKNLDNSKAELSDNGNVVSVSLIDEPANINNLISNEMNNHTMFDFSSLAGRDIKGTVSLTRESNDDSKIGFYVIQNSEGAVLDPITGDLIDPSDSGYEEAALDDTNIFRPFKTLSTRDINAITQVITNFDGASEVVVNNVYTSLPTRTKRDKDIQIFDEDDLIAPYAVNSSGETFFTFEEANKDRINHFRNFGDGSFGLESSLNGGDNDFDDLILSFNFEVA